MSCVQDLQKFRQFQVVVVQRRLANVQEAWSGSCKVLVLLIQTSELLFFSVLPDVVVVLFNLPNVEIEWKLSVPEQLLILNDRYNFSFDNEAIGTRLLMTFSVLFIFPFFFLKNVKWVPLRNRACRYASLVNANFPIICRWKLVKHRNCFGENRRTKDNRSVLRDLNQLEHFS